MIRKTRHRRAVRRHRTRPLRHFYRVCELAFLFLALVWTFFYVWDLTRGVRGVEPGVEQSGSPELEGYPFWFPLSIEAYYWISVLMSLLISAAIFHIAWCNGERFRLRQRELFGDLKKKTAEENQA